jgi:hypothetical protein
LAGPGVPPAELEVVAGRPLAEQQGVAGAVGDVRQPYSGLLEQHPGAALEVGAGDAEVAGQGDRDALPAGDLHVPHPGVGRATERRHHRRQPGVWRVAERRRRLLIGGQGGAVERLLLQVRQAV